MNRTISKLKEMGRTALRGSYWNAVLVSFIMILASPGIHRTAEAARETMESGIEVRVVISSLGGLEGGGIVMTLLAIFVLGPLAVGCKRFFVEDLYRPVDLTFLKAGFIPEYWNVVKVRFFERLFISLWTLLFIVPGIVKAYEYRMVDYLLADYPDMAMDEVFDLSRQMMEGEKLNAFMLDLSFIGWGILSLMTLGLVGVFYAAPYKNLTDAALYAALSDKIRDRG